MRALPPSLPTEGLLVGWSLEAGWRRPLFGFRPRDDSYPSPARALEPILDASEGHLLTVAPTGAGKGVSCIIPALLRYPGPVVVVDPKGENYAVTARRRREMGQEVILFDPFHVTAATSRHRLNPLDLANPDSAAFVEDVATLAHLVGTNPAHVDRDHNPFWAQMARTLVTAAIMDVLTMPDSETATLPAVRSLIGQSMRSLIERSARWRDAPHPELRRLASLMQHPAVETMGGYWTVAVNQLDFLKGQQVATHLAASDLDLNHVYDGAPLSIYLVLPPDKLESHAPLLRLWIGVLTGTLARRGSRPVQDTLLLVDEAAQLGELPQLRQAITLLRGYGVRVWSFWQDLSQLQRLYPDWQTILNNSRIQQYFGATTALAADAVVAVSGYGPRDEILELGRDEMILNVAGDEPVVVRKPNYRSDPPFRGRFDANPLYGGTEVTDEVHSRPIFRRTVAPRAAASSAGLRERMILARGLFHPVPARCWDEQHGEQRLIRLAQAGIAGAATDPEKGLKVRVCRLPFYERYDWAELSDRQAPRHVAYLLIGEAMKPLSLAGDANAIKHANELAPLRLRRVHAARYLEFYCASLIAEHGRLLVIDDVNELEWSVPADESLLAALATDIVPPHIDGGELREGGLLMSATVLYGQTLARSRFRVAADGAVDLLQEVPLYVDLDVVPDVARLPYLGQFDSQGEFTPFRL